MEGTSAGPGARALQSNIRPTVYGSENEAREQEHTSKSATRTVQAHFGREAWPQVHLIFPRYHGRATRPMIPGYELERLRPQAEQPSCNLLLVTRCDRSGLRWMEGRAPQSKEVCGHTHGKRSVMDASNAQCLVALECLSLRATSVTRSRGHWVDWGAGRGSA